MKTMTKLGLLGATFLTTLAFGTPAMAQDGPQCPDGAAPNADGSCEDEAIVVTGSRLRRDPTAVGTPLIQIQREDVQNSGEANLVDYLADVPALSASIVPEDTTGAGLGDGGLSLLNLRALGTDRTLVLLDGRRHVGSGQGFPNVDIDTIPRLLIDNIEVITGGASAIYGADAVAGVVNFITRREFDGFEVDAAHAQINQDGQTNSRISALWGTSGVGGRLNVYLTAEYEASDEVLDSDIDWQRDGCLLLNDDSDPNAATPDGDLDNKIICGARSVSRLAGSILTIAHGTQPSPASDPDIPFAACSPTSIVSTNCFLIDPPFSYKFAPGGAPSLVNFGTFRDHNGTLRTTLVGGDGDELTRFQDSRLPEAEAFRIQGGVSFDINPGLEFFSELKFVQESTLDNFQPAFFDIVMRPNSPNVVFGALNLFAIDLDNAFLDPALKAAIQANVRTVYNAAGAVTGTTPDPRAQVRLFTSDLGGRRIIKKRDMARLVFGLRGEADRFAFLDNFSWEAGYTWGMVEDENVESKTVDAERFALAVDAAVDVLGLVNGVPNQIVCRSQLRAAQGLPVTTNVSGVLAPTDPRITDCVPASLFGEGGLTPAYNYIVTSQRTTNHDEQEDFLIYGGGDLPDVFGAGPLGLLLGYEWRRETFSGRFFGDPNRFLFANLLEDFPKADFSVHEVFGELRIPLLQDLPLAEAVEVTASYRVSDYSNTDQTDTWGAQGSWRVTQDLMFRGTYGVSVRAPALGDLYSPQSQTFLQVTDTCSAPVITATADPTIRANRIANCAILGVSPAYVDPQPGTSNPGRIGGNPDLTSEEATSWTASIVMTPRWVPELSVILDYWTIDVENVIASLTLQQLVNGCTDGSTPNFNFCSLFTRDPTTEEITDFLQSPVNFAGFNARGVDVRVNYGFDLDDVIGRDWGALNFSLTGQWLIERENRLNPLNPSDITELDSTVGLPHGRFATRTQWNKGDWSVMWEMDWQEAQEILDESVLLDDPDLRDPATLDTGEFIQHDFTVGWDVSDNVTMRFGVINAFDEEPSIQSRVADNLDLFGRRFFVGVHFTH